MTTLEIKTNTDLEQVVLGWINKNAEDYDGNVQGVFEDLLRNGCQSGTVSELIYYADTTAFYKKHREEINSLYLEIAESTGIYSPVEVFGDKWEKADPFCDYDLNQNLMAWFGFEETARKLADRAGFEI